MSWEMTQITHNGKTLPMTIFDGRDMMSFRTGEPVLPEFFKMGIVILMDDIILERPRNWFQRIFGGRK